MTRNRMTTTENTEITETYKQRRSFRKIRFNADSCSVRSVPLWFKWSFFEPEWKER
jgi:hypothetical protein